MLHTGGGWIIALDFNRQEQSLHGFCLLSIHPEGLQSEYSISTKKQRHRQQKIALHDSTFWFQSNKIMVCAVVHECQPASSRAATIIRYAYSLTCQLEDTQHIMQANCELVSNIVVNNTSDSVCDHHCIR